MKKNTATKWIVFAFDRTTNAAKIGDAANITANIRIDGGAANAVDDVNPTELEAGYYVFDITDAECNGDLIVICPVSATANVQVIGVPGAVWTDTLAADLATINGVADGLVTAVADVPTVAEFEARSLVAEDYIVVTDLPAAGATQGSVDLIALDTAAVRAKTDNLPAVPAAAGDIPTAVDVADAVWDEATIGHGTVGTTGKALTDAGAAGTPLDAAGVRAAVGLASADLDTQLADLPTISEFDARSLPSADYTVVTDITASSSPASIADAVWNELAVEHVASGTTGRALRDAGALGTPLDAAGVRAAVGLASANLDTQIVNLSTKVVVVDGIVDNILEDTSVIGALGAGLTGIPNMAKDSTVAKEATLGTVPTSAQNADAVLDELVLNHVVPGSMGSVMATLNAGLVTSVAGIGSVANTITVTVGGVAEAGVDVWVTLDEAGTLVVAGTLQTDVLGQVVFWLDPGTYYVWQQKLGFNFTNPDTLVVT